MGTILRLGAFVAVLLGCTSFPAEAREYPWVLLSAENDSRDAEMQDRDEAASVSMVSVINHTETLFDHHLTWKKVAIKNLLAVDVPFCEMHFDAVKPFALTSTEKSVLTEYLKRGGFILFFIDAYPYPQDEFWKVKQWPLIDFLTKELPAASPDFTTGRATDAFPIFKVHYQTTTADTVKHELAGNPNTPNRTLVFYKNQLCCFVMGDYSWLDDDSGKWVAEDRPYSRKFSMELKSYQLIVNIYTFSMLR